MAPPPWANAEQLAFLKSLTADFLQRQKDSTVSRFWPVLYNDWFLRWPERTALFGPEHDVQSALSPDDQERVQEAIDKRKTVSTKMRFSQWLDYSPIRKMLRNWFNNTRRGRGRQADSAVNIGAILDSGTRNTRRTLQGPEMYSKQYYAERVRPVVEEEIKKLDHQPSKGELLALRNKITRDVFEKESAEIQREIDVARYANKSTSSLLNGTSRTPPEFQK